MTTRTKETLCDLFSFTNDSILQNLSSLTARILLALIFVLSGLGKLGALQGTEGYMQAMGVPGILLIPTIAFEIGAGLMVIIGYQTRVTAFLMAGFSLVTGAIFHHNFSNQIQMIMFLKNIAMAGGFLLLSTVGAGPFSFDRR
jgi:putative oxidoreductase